MHVCRIRHVLVVIAIAWTSQVAVAQSPTIQYVYDELGRLIAVTDVNGDTATYTYDAAGNILAIGRYASSQVSIISFSPSSGPIGATVTIYGTGFLPTATQDSVTFNGTPTTVSAATTTQLTVTVPTGATTGTISVSAPGGSATSGGVFSVQANSAPTITSITPTIGIPGTAIMVSGTNFDSVALNNRTRLNVGFANVTSASSTSLGIASPSAVMGGRITVSTPLGTAVSPSDFFVPPSPYAASDVSATGRLVAGVGTSVTIAASNTIGLLLFDESAGHRASLNIASVTMGAVDVSILNPDGTVVSTVTSLNNGAFIEPQVLGSTGTYTILIDPQNTNTGNATFTVYDVPPDVTGTISPGGSSVAVSLATPGQNANLTFAGTAGRRVSLQSTNTTISQATLKIVNPDGTTLASTPINTSPGFIDVQTLPTTGTYTVVVDPAGASTGNTTLTLYDVPADVNGSIVPGGSSVTVTITTPGQNANLTFSGTANQRVSLLAANSTLAFAYLKILNPDGTNLAFGVFNTSGTFIDVQTLPTTGTYSVVVDPSDANTGSVTLTLYAVPADASTTLTIGGSAATLTTTTPGQNALATFSGTSGQQVTVHFTNSSLGILTAKLLNPDGSQLTSTFTLSTNFDFSTQTLPTTGTYTITIDPSGTSVGSITVSVSNP